MAAIMEHSISVPDRFDFSFRSKFYFSQLKSLFKRYFMSILFRWGL